MRKHTDTFNYEQHAHTAVRDVLNHFIVELNLGAAFHPDTDAAEYVDANDEPIFTADKAEKLNDLLDKTFAQCKRYGIDIYGVTLEILNPQNLQS